MSNEKEKQEVGRKIIDLIGKVDTDKKLVYIINATKAWINDAIDRSQYFRICHVISASLDEDLQFLSEHIDDTGDIPYSIEINGLQTTGLACHTNMDKEGNPLYVFTPLSRAVNEYAIKGAGANAIENFNINMSVSSLSKIERGRYNDNISVSLLFDIADGLQIDITMLVTFSDMEKSMWWKPLSKD